jgi:hypothetical protein
LVFSLVRVVHPQSAQLSTSFNRGSLSTIVDLIRRPNQNLYIL